MKTGDSSVRELQALLDEWCNGTLSSQGADRINELVQGNHELAWEYLCYMELHGALRCNFDERHDMPEGRMPSFDSTERMPVIVSPDVGNTDISAGNTVAFRGLWLPYAAAGVFCMLIALVIWRFQTSVDPIAITPPANSNGEVVARLINTSDCNWKDSSRPVRVGDEFRCGDILELESGYANIRSAQGANITLRGPVRLVMTGPNSVQLDSGNLTGEVPEEAKGFTVETASTRIVDFGTEFGVSTEDGGLTALSVFQGMVEIAPRDTLGNVKAKRIFAGQALQINHSGTLGEVQTVDPEQFGLVLQSSTIDSDKSKKITHVDLKRLRSADELQVTGELVSAINVGGKQTLRVNNIEFMDDDGKFISSPMKIDPWKTQPWMGNSPDNLALCQVLNSIRYNLQTIPKYSGDITVAIPVANGCYRLQLLLSESYHACEKGFFDRSINIDLEEQPYIRDLRMLAVQGIAGYPVPPTQAILLRCDLIVDDGELNMVLFSKNVGPGIDPNVILNGLIVERLRNDCD